VAGGRAKRRRSPRADGTPSSHVVKGMLKEGTHPLPTLIITAAIKLQHRHTTRTDTTAQHSTAHYNKRSWLTGGKVDTTEAEGVPYEALHTLNLLNVPPHASQPT